MTTKSRILIVFCASLFGCDRDIAISEGVPSSSSEPEAELIPAPAIVAPNPRVRTSTTEERAVMRARIEIAKHNPHMLLDVVIHGDPSGEISRAQAVSLLQFHCDDWEVLVGLIREIEGEIQVQTAIEAASRLSRGGDFDSAYNLTDAMTPGVARATALREILRAHTSAVGPEEVLDRLLECESDEIKIAVSGFSTGSGWFFRANPDTTRPDLARYDSVKGLAEVVARSYVNGNASSRPHESLDFLKALERSEWKDLVVPLLNGWVQNTSATFDDHLVQKILSIRGAADARMIREKLEKLGQAY